MARVIYGSIITDIKGSIGGITYQKNGSGTIARLKPRKHKTNTQRQRDQQPRLKEVQRLWNELDLGSKIQWNDFADLHDKIGLDGTSKKLTGYQWFMTINQNRLLFDDSFLEEPPTFEVVNPITGGFLDFTSGTLRFFYNDNLGGLDSKVIVYGSFVLNSASVFDFNKNRLLSKFKGASFTGQNMVVSENIGHWNNYYNSSFPPSLGNKSFYLTAYVKFIGVSSGISSLGYTTIAKFNWNGSEYEIE